MEDFAGSVIAWYTQGHRRFPWRETHDPYRIWVSEVMLQQTRAETVISYYNRFLELFPDIHALAEADETVLMKAWEGLGYYSRARNLQKCARVVCEHYGGKFPETPEALESLPGIGAYTAGAIASIAFGFRCAAVDGNVLRVIARVRGIEEDIRAPGTVRRIRDLTTALLPERDCDLFSNAMMELGACVCVPRQPHCELCPVRALCSAFRIHAQDRLPVRSKDRQKRVEKRDILLVYADGKVLVMRQDAGLLEGLYTFLNLDGWESGQVRLRELQDRGITVSYLGMAGTARHVFTHVIWEMHIHEFQATGTDEFHTWTDREGIENLPMATAIQKARQICLARLNDNTSGDPVNAGQTGPSDGPEDYVQAHKD